MADFNGVNYALAYVTQPKNPPQSNLVRGSIMTTNDTFEAAGEAIGSVILIGRVQKGTVILPESIVTHDALGASSTLEIKTRGVVSPFTQVSIYAAEDTSSAGTVGGTGDIDDFPFTVAEDSDLILLTAGGTVTGTIKSDIRFAEI